MPEKRTPVHLWIVAVVAVLWDAMGAYDYLMTQTENASYMSRFTEAQIAYFTGFPIWVVTAWAIAVWGGVLASVLLLLRKKLATPVFLVSLLAMVATLIHNFLLSDGLEIMGGAGPLAVTALVFLMALGLYLYARAMQARGVLS